MKKYLEEKSIKVISFEGEKEKWCMWPCKFMARDIIKGCVGILGDTVTTQKDSAEKIKDKVYTMVLKVLKN